MATSPQAAATTAAASPVRDAATMHLSPTGLGALTFRKVIKHHYYPDQAHDCTYDIGTLFHHGPYMAAETRTIVSGSAIQPSLATDVDRFETMVGQGVPTRKPTQNQFDALVSFAYNAPHNPTEAVLALVEAGKDADVGALMKTVVYIHVCDKKGHRSRIPVLSQGLLTRRNSEAAQCRSKPVKIVGYLLTTLLVSGGAAAAPLPCELVGDWKLATVVGYADESSRPADAKSLTCFLDRHARRRCPPSRSLMCRRF